KISRSEIPLVKSWGVQIKKEIAGVKNERLPYISLKKIRNCLSTEKNPLYQEYLTAIIDYKEKGKRGIKGSRLSANYICTIARSFASRGYTFPKQKTRLAYISLQQLEEAYSTEEDDKAKERIRFLILYKQGDLHKQGELPNRFITKANRWGERFLNNQPLK